MTIPYLTSNLIEVALADDHLLFRQALKRSLLLQGDFKISIEASGNAELIRQLANAKNAVVLLDLFMPDLESCIGTIGIIHEKYPDATIIILTMCNDEHIKTVILKHGIFAFIHKSVDMDQLIDCIRRAAHHHAGNARQYGYSGRQKPVAFSTREIEILRLIVAGATNKEIAQKIYLSLRSIEQIRHKMKERIDAKNTVSLIKYALDNKII